MNFLFLIIFAKNMKNESKDINKTQHCQKIKYVKNKNIKKQ